MTAQQFLDDALAGGWKYDDIAPNITTANMLLHLGAWQAVGKTRHWNFSHTVGSHSDDRGGESDIPCDCLDDKWKRQWHRFIDHLADGATIEEALTKLI